MLRKCDILQYDSETTGRDPHLCDILCIQFGSKKYNFQIVIDTKTVQISLYQGILENTLLVGHNLKFDLQFLYNYQIIPLKIFDTMIIEQLLHLGYDHTFRYSLQEVAKRYLDVYVDKTVRGHIIYEGLNESTILYSATDVVYLEDIKELQEKELKFKQCTQGAIIENAFVPVIAYLEWCGIRLDVEKWQKKMYSDLEKQQEALDALNNWLITYENSLPKPVTEIIKIHGNAKKAMISMGYQEVSSEEGAIIFSRTSSRPFTEVNLQGDLFSGFDTTPKVKILWSSSIQVVPLFKMLGFNTVVRDKETGKLKESLEEKVIAPQKGINDEFLKLYFAYQQACKVVSTWGQNFIDSINPITKRIHTNFKQLGAASGRMACGNGKDINTDIQKITHKKASYLNLQNLPADEPTRSSFVPEPGNLMCSCDYSALESRLGADIYNEPAMINEFLHGTGDMHSLCASLVFKDELAGIPVPDIKKVRPDLRKKVKPVEFAKQFGGGASAIMGSLGCTKKEAEAFSNAYDTGFSGITAFKETGTKFVSEYGFVLICKYTGHKLYWQDWAKWRDVEDTPEYIRNREYSKAELREHDKALAKWSRMSLNAPTQGSGIIILKIAMVLFFKWIVQNKLFGVVKICDLVHDEAVIEYPETMPEVAQVLKEKMELAASYICKKLPIPAEAEVGLHWIH